MTTGLSNTAIGMQAMNALTTASNCVGIGKGAGASVTTGGNNILIGVGTGVSAAPGGDISTGTNEIVLGNSSITEAHIKVAWSVSSDERDKTDFTPLDVGLNFINDLEPLTYRWDQRSDYVNWKNNPDTDLNLVTHDGTYKKDQLDLGFSAQSVEKLEEQYGYKISDKTNLTTTLSGDGKQYSLKYSKFVPIRVKALQELSAEVEKLKKEK
jgi:hypothetical protein